MSEPRAHFDDEPPLDLETEPFEPAEAFAYDWGGDGSDHMRPVRAHVLQTLRVETEPYYTTSERAAYPWRWT